MILNENPWTIKSLEKKNRSDCLYIHNTRRKYYHIHDNILRVKLCGI